MNGYGLVAEIVHSITSLAWPAALVWIVWIFRERLGELLPFLWIKHKDLEVSFRLDQAEKEASALVPVGESAEPTPEETSKFEQIAALSPNAAITEVRRELEDVLKKRATQLGLDLGRATILSITRALRQRNLIDQQTSALLDDLRVIGNEAVHGGDDTTFTKDDALRFRKLADQVISQLQASGANSASRPGANT